MLTELRLCDKRQLLFVDENRTVNLQILGTALSRLDRNGNAIIARNLAEQLSRLEILRLIKRVTVWPTEILGLLDNSDPSVSLRSEPTSSLKKLRAQLANQIPSRSSFTNFHSIIPDHHFPCPDSSGKQISPFTQTIRRKGVDAIYLSCVAYFEVKMEPTFGTDNGSIFVGLANPNFQSSLKLGGDVNSFGYHSRDGHLYHGDENVGIHFGPPFSIGDVVGCGLVYPPLAADQGEIFFTRNGEIIGVVELLDVGHLDIPWYPMVGLNCGQRVTFNFGSDDFRFPILDFEAEELKNRWGNDMQTSSSIDVYCVHVYNKLLNQNYDFHGSARHTSQIDSSVTSHQYDSYGQVIEYPAATMSHRSSNQCNTLGQVKNQTLHTVVHEIPIRKRKFCDDMEECKEINPVRYQRFKTWTQSESAGSWAGSSNDSWEEENIEADMEMVSEVNRKSLPRRDSDRTLSSYGDNQSFDETQSCIAVEGEITLAEYLQLAESGGMALPDEASITGRMGVIGEDIDHAPIAKYEEGEADNEIDGDVSSDDRSIATSLFVEVASVDGYGSYFGYGGASESDDEVDESYDCDLDSERISSGYGTGGYRQTNSSPHSSSERCSRHKSRSRREKTKSAEFMSHKDNAPFSPHQQEGSILLSSFCSRNTSLFPQKWNEDGYDAAEEEEEDDIRRIAVDSSF